jgi:predicted RNase H-like HicB family nuclease
MRHYIALIHKDADSDFGVSFPDFPGCITAGTSLQEAFAMASEALAGHIEAMSEEGYAIPDPSSADAIARDPENRDGVFVLVPTPDATVKTVRVNITLPETLLRRIDSRTSNRSGFLARAAEKALEEAQRPGKAKARAEGSAGPHRVAPRHAASAMPEKRAGRQRRNR